LTAAARITSTHFVGVALDERAVLLARARLFAIRLHTTALQRQAYAIVTQPHCFTLPAMPEPLNGRDMGAKEFPIL
jgi:hypothetical protein